MNAYERRQEIRIAKEKLRKQRRQIDRMMQAHKIFTAFENAHSAAYGFLPHISGDFSGYHLVVYKGKSRRMTLKAMQRETEILWAKVHEREIGNG